MAEYAEHKPIALALALVGAAACAMAQAGQARTTAPIHRLGPKVDGFLSDPFWDDAGVTSRFIARGSAEPASPATVAKLAATHDALYVGFVCADLEPQEVVVVELAPYAALPLDGAARPGASRGVVRLVAGVDGSVKALCGKAKATCAVQRLKGGGTFEIRVPFAGLVPQHLAPRRGDLWAANFRRNQGEDADMWAVPTEKRPVAGTIAFAGANLMENGGAEAWEKMRPKGWSLVNWADGKSTRAMCLREPQLAVEGQMACRVLYRGKLEVRPAGRLALRKGALYRLSLTLTLQPDPGTKAVATLSAAPNKTGTFTPPNGALQVDMPFRAKADHAEPAVIVCGRSGAAIIDNFRMEMVLPD